MIWNRDKSTHTDSRVDPSTRDDHALTDDSGRAAHVDPDNRVLDAEEVRHERWGGMNLGAGFFGWLVAMGMAALLAGVVGAVAAAVGDSNDITQSQLERESGQISVAAAIVLVAVLVISFYAGGYVAGRMSRFDGARQGLAVWLVSLVVVVIAAVLGVVFGSEYDIMNRVDVPDVPIPTEDLTLGGAVTIAAAVLATLLAALAGGKAGTHYHRRVDRTAR